MPEFAGDSPGRVVRYVKVQELVVEDSIEVREVHGSRYLGPGTYIQALDFFTGRYIIFPNDSSEAKALRFNPWGFAEALRFLHSAPRHDTIAGLPNCGYPIINLTTGELQLPPGSEVCVVANYPDNFSGIAGFAPLVSFETQFCLNLVALLWLAAAEAAVSRNSGADSVQHAAPQNRPWTLYSSPPRSHLKSAPLAA